MRALNREQVELEAEKQLSYEAQNILDIFYTDIWGTFRDVFIDRYVDGYIAENFESYMDTETGLTMYRRTIDTVAAFLKGDSL